LIVVIARQFGFITQVISVAEATEKPNKTVPINSHPGLRAGMFVIRICSSPYFDIRYSVFDIRYSSWFADFILNQGK